MWIAALLPNNSAAEDTKKPPAHFATSLWNWPAEKSSTLSVPRCNRQYDNEKKKNTMENAEAMK
jgi:hypothetical protein